MNKVFLIPIVLFVLAFTACKNESPNFIDIKFEQSAIYINKYCDANTSIKVNCKSNIPIEDSLVFKVFLAGSEIDQFILPTGFQKRQGFELSIPPYSTHQKDQISCRVSSPSNSNKSINIHYVEPDQEVSFIKYLPFKEQNFHLTQHYWDNYNELPLPSNTEFDLQSELQIQTIKKDGQVIKRLSYDVNLIDQSTGTVVTIEPTLEKEYRFPEALDLRAENKKITYPDKDNLFGSPASISIHFTTTDKNLAPGYQVYSYAEGISTTAQILDCDSINVLAEKELIVPQKILFKSFPQKQSTELFE